MLTILLIFFAFYIPFLFFAKWARKYESKYTFHLIFGPKGVGKSTILHKYAFRHLKKGWKIACNIGDLNPDLFPAGTLYAFPAKDIYLFAEAYDDPDHPEYHDRSLKIQDMLKKKYDNKLHLDHYYLEPDTCVFVDEINLLWDNRDFANLDGGTKAYTRLQRHYKHKLIAFSQTFDCDKKFRDQVDYLFIAHKLLHVFTWCTRYKPRPEMLVATNDNNRDTSKPIQNYDKRGIFPRYFAWIPHWVKKFDSFKRMDLQK